MADLLECLLQIKGLRETADRVAVLVHRVEPTRWMQAAPGNGPCAADVLAQLAEIESLHGEWLRLMLASSRPVLSAFDDRALFDVARRHGWEPPAALDRFLAHRRHNLEVLDRCSAADLSRVGVHPVRREVSVADLVAVMLANDVDRLGEIRRALGV
jgi:hypothetical protein